MHHISKHFTADNYDQLILEEEDWSAEVWQALCKIFGFTKVDTMIFSEYKMDAWVNEEEKT